MVTLALGDGRSTTAPVKRAATWWVDTIDTPAAIAPHRAAWDDLAWHAIEPNPFYESWMVEAGWTMFPPADLRLACVYRGGVRPQDPPELCGLIPLVRRRHEQLPVTVWSLWHNDYLCNCTPLLRQGVAVEAWRTLVEWLGPQSLPLFELPLVTADGPFQQTLQEVLNERQTVSHVDRQYGRALLKPAESAEAYCASTMTCHNRQELRRQRRRLGEQGTLEVRTYPPGDTVDPWIDEFLRLESAGWKGREGTAFASREQDAAYLRAIITAAAARRQVALLGLYLDGRAIALKLNFLAGSGGFTFKIAFDESYKKFSPGVQLELENIEWFHGQPGIAWLDSCARPDHFMIGRLWRDRRAMQYRLLSTGSRWGDVLVGGWVFAKALKSACRARKRPATAGVTEATPTSQPPTTHTP